MSSIEQTSREWTFTIKGAPHTFGTTSSLNRTAIDPYRMTLIEGRSGTVHAVIVGRRIKANGEPSAAGAVATIKLAVTELDGSMAPLYERAPDWVQQVYRDVS